MEHTCDVIGHFIYDYGKCHLLTNEAEALNKTLNVKKIFDINHGKPVNCDRPYVDFFHNSPEKAKAGVFTTTNQLEDYLNQVDFKNKSQRPLILARTQPVASLVKQILGIHDRNEQPKNFTFRIDSVNGFKLCLESSDMPEYIPGKTHNETAVTEYMIKEDNSFDEVHVPTLGDKCNYRVLRHAFTENGKGFEIILSKKFDVVASVDEGPAEIRTSREGKDFNLKKMLLSTAFLGDMDTAYINVIRGKTLVKVQKVGSIRALDHQNHISVSKKFTFYLFQWLLDVVKFTGADSGTVQRTDCGIVVHAKNYYAIFNKFHPRELNCFPLTLRPSISFNQELPATLAGPKIVLVNNMQEISSSLLKEPDCFIFTYEKTKDAGKQVVTEHGYRSFLQIICPEYTPQMPGDTEEHVPNRCYQARQKTTGDHCLYLVSEKETIEQRCTCYDLLRIPVFLKNGPDLSLTTPARIVVMGSKEDFDEVKDTAAKWKMSARVCRYR